MKIVALKTAATLAVSHGLSERWLKARKDVFTSSRQVDADALELAVYSSSKKPTLLKPLAKEWNNNTARTITKIIVNSKSNSLWAKHFLSTRQSSRVSIKTVGDLAKLQPRAAFFTDYLAELHNNLSLNAYSTLLGTLKNNEKCVKAFLSTSLTTPEAQKRILSKDYEDVYTRMLDAVNLGQTLEKAYSTALDTARSNQSVDEGSAKEVPLYFPEQVCDVTSGLEEMFLSKQTRLLMDAFHEALRLHYKNSRHAPERFELAVAIFEQAIQGATDNEIIAKLGLTCTRQRMQQVRSMVMGLAQRVFRSAVPD